LESGRNGKCAAEAGFSGGTARSGTVLQCTPGPEAFRRPLKARNFITALYCRDSCCAAGVPGSLFFAGRKPLCYISRGDKAFVASGVWLDAQNRKLAQNSFKTKAKGVKQ
jgi:hypothetical protein